MLSQEVEGTINLAYPRPIMPNLNMKSGTALSGRRMRGAFDDIPPR